jgi:hypothetical protein
VQILCTKVLLFFPFRSHEIAAVDRPTAPIVAAYQGCAGSKQCSAFTSVSRYRLWRRLAPIYAEQRHRVWGSTCMNRLRTLSARAPSFDIFSDKLVLRHIAGWQITDGGRQLLGSLEAPMPEAPSSSIASSPIW